MKPQPEVRDEAPSSRAERHPAFLLAERVLTNWGHTTRAIIVVIAVIGITVLALWLLPVDLQVGPVRLTRH